MAKKSRSKQQEKQLDELFVETLKDIYYAEKKLASALPKMAKAAQSEELAEAFEKHAEETEGQIERLEEIFAMVDETPKGKTCDAINGWSTRQGIMSNSKTRLPTTSDCSLPRRPSSTTRFLVMELLAHGPRNLGCAMRSS